ncbi:rhamnulokinase [Oscillospiraceae bacterium HV4-5-C5C]|nr:rhamnulokinase [Oscillospiraceae bacterium HV4-5-C5C]
MSKNVLAFDFGASSGRAMLGRFDGQKLSLEEIHRFANDPVKLGSTLYWDFLRQFYEIRQGLIKARLAGNLDSLGIDTWGVDFGLLGADGRLLDQPVHYRDQRTDGAVQELAGLIPDAELYEQTGLQFLNFNTLYQLCYLRRRQPGLLDQAETALLIPDLFAYFLTGERFSEYTIASTTALLDPRTRDWNRDLFRRLNLPELFPAIKQPGSYAAPLTRDLCRELDLPAAWPLIRTASHDTASAVAAVPAEGEDFIYISSGTWSLMGIEAARPIINEDSRRLMFTNEGACNGRIRFLKNIMGLWLIQETRRQWIREGQQLSYADMEEAALVKPPFRSLIDPDDRLFATPGNLPERIRQRCRETGQPVPADTGAVVRCIYESLALKYRIVKEGLETVSRKHYRKLHVVGGGTKDGLLSQFTANATGLPVWAGPAEATAIGNMLVQLISTGALKDLAQARQLVRQSFDLKLYEPRDCADWDDACARFKTLWPQN